MNFLVIMCGMSIVFLVVPLGLTVLSVMAGVPEGEMNRLLVLGFIGALVVFIIVIIGGISLFVFPEADDIWLSAGFYGGAIGSLITTILFWMIIRYTSSTPLSSPPMYPPNQRRYDRSYRY